MNCQLYEQRKFDSNKKELLKKYEQFIYDVRKARLPLMFTPEVKQFDINHETIFIKYCDGKFHYKTNSIDIETVIGKCSMFTGKKLKEKVDEVKQETKRIMTFDNFENNPDVIDFLMGFMGNTEKNTVILEADTARGKTHLARSLQIYEIGKGKNVEFIMSEDLNKIFMEYETWNEDKLGKWEAKKKYNNMLNAKLLIIDDLGSEKISKTDHFSTQLLILLEKMKGKLLITTNLMMIIPDDFKKIENENKKKYLNNRYNDRIMSRILEKAKNIKLSGKDWRLKKNNIKEV